MSELSREITSEAAGTGKVPDTFTIPMANGTFTFTKGTDGRYTQTQNQSEPPAQQPQQQAALTGWDSLPSNRSAQQQPAQQQPAQQPQQPQQPQQQPATFDPAGPQVQQQIRKIVFGNNMQGYYSDANVQKAYQWLISRGVSQEQALEAIKAFNGSIQKRDGVFGGYIDKGLQSARNLRNTMATPPPPVTPDTSGAAAQHDQGLMNQMAANKAPPPAADTSAGADMQAKWQAGMNSKWQQAQAAAANKAPPPPEAHGLPGSGGSKLEPTTVPRVPESAFEVLNEARGVAQTQFPGQQVDTQAVASNDPNYKDIIATVGNTKYIYDPVKKTFTLLYSAYKPAGYSKGGYVKGSLRTALDQWRHGT
jgi:hypothetical protein